MRGEELTSTELGLQGLPGDRRYAFVQAESRSLFPWLTARELPDLLRCRPAYDETAPRPRLHVTVPSGATFPIDSEDLRRELEHGAGRRLFLLGDYRGNYDVAPVSLISSATVARIAAASETRPEPGRFRANFYLETADAAPFAEEGWVGRVLRLGETARLAVTEPDKRCAMVNLDPETGVASPVVLRSIAGTYGNKAGAYGVVLTPGVVSAGDPVYLEAQAVRPVSCSEVA